MGRRERQSERGLGWRLVSGSTLNTNTLHKWENEAAVRELCDRCGCYE